MSIKLEDALEISLQRLQAGAGLEETLAAFGEQAAELKPLLVTAQAATERSADVYISPAAQNRSRMRFLTAAAFPPSAPRRWRFSLFHLRLAASSLILAGVLAVVLLGTGLASAAALPGDMLYPVKRMVESIQINMAQDPPTRLGLEENLDDRRLDEVARLSQINRREFVTFSGVLHQTADDRWIVGDLVLKFPTATPEAQFIDRYVQVSGYSDSRQVTVEEIQLRSFSWEGTLQQMESDIWLVGGIQVKVDDNTRLSGADPYMGAAVYITAMRLPDNHYTALTVWVSPAPTAAHGATVPPQLTQTPSPEPTRRATRDDPEEVKKTEVPARSATPNAGKSPTAHPTEKNNSATRFPSQTPAPEK